MEDLLRRVILHYKRHIDPNQSDEENAAALKSLFFSVGGDSTYQLVSYYGDNLGDAILKELTRSKG